LTCVCTVAIFQLGCEPATSIRTDTDGE
jgi:hypothetical protein